jgi:hypothetical protein
MAHATFRKFPKLSSAKANTAKDIKLEQLDVADPSGREV